MTRSSVRWRVILWIAGSVIGAVVVALPDSDERVFSLSRTHGPSLVDLLGVIILVGSWLPLAAVLPALWRLSGAVPARLSAGLAMASVLGLAVTIAADMGPVWMVAAGLLVAAQVIVIVDGWRLADRQPSSRG